MLVQVTCSDIGQCWCRWPAQTLDHVGLGDLLRHWTMLVQVTLSHFHFTFPKKCWFRWPGSGRRARYLRRTGCSWLRSLADTLSKSSHSGNIYSSRNFHWLALSMLWYSMLLHSKILYRKNTVLSTGRDSNRCYDESLLLNRNLLRCSLQKCVLHFPNSLCGYSTKKKYWRCSPNFIIYIGSIWDRFCVWRSTSDDVRCAKFSIVIITLSQFCKADSFYGLRVY
jgi:hypothetical protein